MNIGPETVAVFHYTLRDEAGEELETSRGSDPNAYLHGAKNIIPGLESAMTGKDAAGTRRPLGQARDVVVPASCYPA